jgi:D-sedoheptulose 7-phosphate isomerase
MKSYVDKLMNSIKYVPDETLSVYIELLVEAFNRRAQIFIVGNGGSAATASHFATDLNKIKNINGLPGRAISLCDNSSLITAYANDISFDSIFKGQLENLANSKDILIAISASGKSKNIIEAIRYAKKNDIYSVGLVGFDAGNMNICDLVIHTKSELGDYGPTEDAHSIICHYTTEELKYRLNLKSD